MSLSTLSGHKSWYPIGYFPDKCHRRNFHASWKAINNILIIKNLSVEKETLSTVPGFEPGTFDYL